MKSEHNSKIDLSTYSFSLLNVQLSDRYISKHPRVSFKTEVSVNEANTTNSEMLHESSCVKHSLMKQEAFCKKCYELLCVKCLIGKSHQGHPMTTMDKAAQLEFKQITKTINDLDNRRACLDLIIDQTEIKVFESRQLLESQLHLLNSQMNNLIEELRQ